MQNQRASSIHDPRYKRAIEILIRARKSAGLSQTDLAEKVGFTQPDISKVERLDRRLDLTEFFDVLHAISDGDRAVFDQLWNEIDECHSGLRSSGDNTSSGD